MADLPKTFDPKAIERRWYAHWESRGLFRPDRPDAEPWTIVMPPPNVTGSLHIGHALDITLQDVLTRRERMRGKDALWVVGTDHAGIATQMVVERNLELSQDKRTNYTREQFVDKVWEWKAESGGQITGQLRRLGASCDWAHERFTMDEGFSRAVVKVFVELWKRKLLYRDKRLVNWDPKFQTAISDLEVETKEVPGKFWTLRYPLADGSGAIEVATTRPETMLADMAVAVHPDDERYKDIVGKQVKLPITGRLIPVIADEHADPELGSGAVKITPGHDFNDFEVGKRAGIKAADMLNMFDAQARVIQTQDGLIPAELLGLDREEARNRVVERLEAEGALVRVDDRVIPTPFGDRSGVVIEPWLTDQWYVDVKPLAERVIDATRAGKIRIVPESWAKTWFNWLENIQPWCVSRQLWWGHRIPAWYGPPKDWPSRLAAKHTGKTFGDVIIEQSARNRVWDASEMVVFVAESQSAAMAQARAFYGPEHQVGVGADQMMDWVTADGRHITVLEQDEDVLDTWFSSALWPFATLGWPDDAVESPLPFRGGEEPRSGKGVGETSAATFDKSPTLYPSPEGEGKSDLARHYPNDVLISGFDILFFWDARMAMQGLEFMGEVPWKTLYLHGLVRDAHGQKMSKSKGNTVDPLGLIDKYGADALRFTLAAMESQGRDIKLDEKRVEGYRNFATKLWNAARFLQMNGVGASDSVAAPEAELPVNRWIIGEVVETLAKLNAAFDELRFDEMADAIYHFVWGTFCDWYVELVKPLLSPSPSGEGTARGSGSGVGASSGLQSPTPCPSPEGEGLNEAEETRKVAAWAFDQILVMLHPLMPFITEELWHANQRPYDLIVAQWPEPQAQVDRDAKAEMEWVIGIIENVRSIRAETSIPPGLKIIVGTDRRSLSDQQFEQQKAVFIRHGPMLARIANIEAVEFFYTGVRIHLATGELEDRTEERHIYPGSGRPFAVDGVDYLFGLEGLIDTEAEKERLSKAAAAAAKERDSLAARLANPNFVERAKPEAVEKARSDHEAKLAEAERLRAALERLG